MMTWKGKVLGNQVAVELDFWDNNDDLRDYGVLWVILIYLDGRSKEKEKWNNRMRTWVMSENLDSSFKRVPYFLQLKKDVFEDQA